MNLIKLAWKNLRSKPLSMLLNLLLFGLGVGLVVFLLLINYQVNQNFEKNLAGIDLVVGAKGSPMQMILCNMYHIDAPTGNISVKDIRPFFNPKHPVVKEAIPLSLGDNYKAYRIVGTDTTFVDLYDATIAKGRMWRQDYEVVIGSLVADRAHLHLGDEFFSSHGLADDGINVHDHGSKFRVVGILEPNQTVADQLILCNTPTIWAVHDHEGHDHDDHDHSSGGEAHAAHDDHGDHDHHDHDHDHDHADAEIEEVAARPFHLLDHPEQSITSILIKFRNHGIQSLNFPRAINENTDLMAAQPAWQINRVRDMMGTGTDMLRLLAGAIIFVSAISLFISLFSSLRGRKYELAILRVMGGSRKTLFTLIILEGLILAVLGYLLGIFLGHLGVGVLGGELEATYKYRFSPWIWLKEEYVILAVLLLLSFVASLLPAIKASRTPISETLSEG
jgi:putative ABC transport system permease protein